MEIFSIAFFLTLGLGLGVGALIGIGLGRRSNTANTYYDRARAEWDLREAQLQAQIDRLREKYGEK